MLVTLAYGSLWLSALGYAAHARLGRLWTGRAASSLAIASWGVLTAALIERGLAAGHWPLANRYEFSLCFAWSILFVYLLLEFSWRERRAGACVLAMALLAASYAISRPAAEQASTPLLPALRSAWLQIHVGSAAISYGAFGTAAGLGLARLLQVLGEGERAWLPPGQDSERGMWRTIALGFPWLTLSILAGAVWAQAAWGRWWGWDPKETWALVTWLWYLAMLHVRPLPSWRGRRLAGLAIAGLGIIAFTFIGVPWLVRAVSLQSLHGF